MELTEGYTDDNKQWLKPSKKSLKMKSREKQDHVSEDKVIIIGFPWSDTKVTFGTSLNYLLFYMLYFVSG